MSTLSIVDSLHRHLTDDGVNFSVLKSVIRGPCCPVYSGLLCYNDDPSGGSRFASIGLPADGVVYEISSRRFAQQLFP